MVDDLASRPSVLLPSANMKIFKLSLIGKTENSSAEFLTQSAL
jgi:hypothetical protein